MRGRDISLWREHFVSSWRTYSLAYANNGTIGERATAQPSVFGHTNRRSNITLRICRVRRRCIINHLFFVATRAPSVRLTTPFFSCPRNKFSLAYDLTQRATAGATLADPLWHALQPPLWKNLGFFLKRFSGFRSFKKVLKGLFLRF